MTSEQVRQLSDATPFKPFITHLAGGREILVKHREFTAVSPSGRTIFVYQADDAFSIIDLFLITEFEVRNGKGPKTRHS